MKAKHCTSPPVTLNNIQVTESEDAKFLGIHLDKPLTWEKRKQLGIEYRCTNYYYTKLLLS